MSKMSNKKKRKSKEDKEKQDLLILVGNVLDEKYQKLTEEIFLMQEEVKREQRKEDKRAYKRMKKHNDLYLPSKAKLRESTIAKLEGNIKSGESKLNNEAFVSKAPAKIIEGAKAQLELNKTQLAKVQAQLKEIEAL